MLASGQLKSKRRTAAASGALGVAKRSLRVNYWEASCLWAASRLLFPGFLACERLAAQKIGIAGWLRPGGDYLGRH